MAVVRALSSQLKRYSKQTKDTQGLKAAFFHRVVQDLLGYCLRDGANENFHINDTVGMRRVSLLEVG